MYLYRLVHPRYYSTALQGAASARFPGRWNLAGQSVIYTSCSTAVAISERTTWTDYYGLPRNVDPFILLPIAVPDMVSREAVREEDLPADWRAQLERSESAAPTATQRLGAAWLKRGTSCLLFVPSAVVADGSNCLINPAHRDFGLITLAKETPPPPADDKKKSAPRRPSRRMRDVFLSYASENHVDVVEPLKRELDTAGITYWYDRHDIQWGDGIVAKVNQGLGKCRYVIVVLSTAFLAKEWTRREWQAALAKEFQLRRTFVLPLLVGSPTERGKIIKKLTLQADKRYLTWENNAATIVQTLTEVMTRGK